MAVALKEDYQRALDEPDWVSEKIIFVIQR